MKVPKVEFDGGYLQIVNPGLPVTGVSCDIVYIKKGGRFPRHYHNKISSTLICLEGEGEVGINNEIKRLKKNDCIFIPKGVVHHLVAFPDKPFKCLSINEGIIGTQNDKSETDVVLVDKEYSTKKWNKFVSDCEDAAIDFIGTIEDRDQRTFRI